MLRGYGAPGLNGGASSFLRVPRCVPQNVRPCPPRVSTGLKYRAVPTASASTLTIETLQEGRYDFGAAEWVSDIVPEASQAPEEHTDEQPSSTSSNVTDVATSWTSLPQGYRTADHVAVYRVPTPAPSTLSISDDDGPALYGRSSKDSLVVYKVSNYRDPVTQEMDSFKFAATLNEWSTFSKFAAEMQSRHLVQLLGYSKSATSVCIVSEYCELGDLQSLIDHQTGPAPPTSPVAATAEAATGEASVLRTVQPLAAALPDEQAAPARPAQQAAPSPCPDMQQQQQQLPHAATLAAWCVLLGSQVQSAVARLVGVVSCWLAHQACRWTALSAALAQWVQSTYDKVKSLGRGQGQKERWGELMTSQSPVGPTMSEAQVAHVAAHIVQGLATLHKAGLTHGDVKPANVFISRVALKKRHPSLSVPYKLQHAKPRPLGSLAADTQASAIASASMDGGCEANAATPAAGNEQGQVQTQSDMVFKLGDFGTMRERGRKHLHYFCSGFGYSPEYAAPEALRYGTTKVDQRSDLWSLGIMLVQLLLGRLPGTAVAMANLQDASCHKERAAFLAANVPGPSAVAELKQAHANVSPALLGVIEACLQVSPSQRPLDASQLLKFEWFTSGEAHQVQLAV